MQRDPSFVDISRLVGNNDDAVWSNCEPDRKRVLIHAGLHRHFVHDEGTQSSQCALREMHKVGALAMRPLCSVEPLPAQAG